MKRRHFLAYLSLLPFAALPVTAAPEGGWRLFAVDGSTKRLALVAADGSLEWQYQVGDVHDLHRLRNGNLLFQTSFTRLVEVDPKTNQVVWEYDSGKNNGNEGHRVEVHAFQRLPQGVTMIAESGPSRIIEVDHDGKLLKEIKLKVSKPDAHRDTRLVRKLRNGHYLVCHEGDGIVREYDENGSVAWEYNVPLFGKEPKPGHGPEAFGNQTFSAVRLQNGNTLISTGNGHSIIEVTPAKEIVWSLHQNDLPGITLAWVTTLQVLPNGNIIFGNCHAGPDNPQIVEVNRDKKVVWTFKDFKNFGNSLTNSLVLDTMGRSLR